MTRVQPHARSPFDGFGRRKWTRWLFAAILPGALIIAAAHGLDRTVYEWLSVSKPELNALELKPTYRLIWLFGSMWTWLIIAVALYLHDRTPPPIGPRAALGQKRDPAARAVAVAGSAILAGVIAEALKWVIKRERPTRLEDGAFIEQIYTFKWPDLFTALSGGSDAMSAGEHFSRWLSSSNLGMPSSHAAVAFAGAAAVAVLLPTQRGLVLALAALCAMSRVLASAHTLSDVVVGSLIGLLASAFVVPWAMRRSSVDVVPAWALGTRTGRSGRA